MDPDTLGKVGRSLRENPGRTAAALLLLLALFSLGAWATGYLQERGRQLADQPQSRQAAPQLRLQYYRFQGTPLLDLVTRGYGFSPAEGFAQRPQWLKNTVYQQLSEILSLNRFWPPPPGYRNLPPFDITRIYLEHPTFKAPLVYDAYSRPQEDAPSVPEPKEISQLLGTMQTFRGGNIVHGFPEDFLIEKLRTDPYWTVRPDPDYQPPDSEVYDSWYFSFFASPTKDEILSYFSPRQPHRPALHDPLSRKLLDRYPSARDLVFLNVRPSHDAYYGELLIREIALVSLDVENTGGVPVTVSALRAFVLPRPDAYTLTDTRAAQETTRHEEEMSIPLEQLLPGEHLMIPLRIEFGVPGRSDDRTFFNSEGILLPSYLPGKDDFSVIPGDIVQLEIVRGVDNDSRWIREIERVSKAFLRGKFDFKNSIPEH